MMNRILLITLSCLSCLPLFGQGNLGLGTITPHGSAKLDVESTTQGMLIPRMVSAQRVAIVSPTMGLLVYDTTTKSVWQYNGTTWINLATPYVLADADADTKIMVEKNPDEDIIRFDMGGTEQFRMVDGRLEVLNTGQSIFIGEGAGLNDDFSANMNVFIGNKCGNANTTGRSNVAIGNVALYRSIDKTNLVAIGDSALYNNGTSGMSWHGTNNTAVGPRAMVKNTTGSSNTAYGSEALYSNTIGGENTALGNFALRYANASLNTAIGSNALNLNSSGSQNTAVGASSMQLNTSGSNNTAIGNNALVANTSAHNNTAIGFETMKSNTEGYSNTAIGTTSFYSNRKGYNATAVGASAMYYANNTLVPYENSNVAVGFESLRGSTNSAANTGLENTAVGFKALKLFTSGAGNTALGFLALTTSSSASNNTAIGRSALRLATSGSQNTAVGSFALESNIIGTQNVAIGQHALKNSLNSFNTAIGFEALLSNQNAPRNTAIGHSALKANTTGENNTAIGIFALEGNITGHNNTAIGYSANSNAGSFTNSTGLGYDADPNATNRIHIGNGSVTWIGGQVAWSTYSDARFKINVQENVRGLEFISRLRPVTYHFDLNAYQDWKELQYGERDESDYPEKYAIESKTFSGFIAQEVEAAALASGFDFSGVCTPEHDKDLYALRYAEFVVPLVKAVQELIEKVNSQEETISTLSARLDTLALENQALLEKN